MGAKMNDICSMFLEWYAHAKIYEFFVTWQTGIAALIALLGAYWTVRAVRSQIAQAEQVRLQTERLTLERRQRDDRAASAVLPLSLSDLMEYCTACIQLIDANISVPYDSRPNLPIDQQAPAIPSGVAAALQACALHAEPENVNKIVKVLGKLQVQSSRMSSFIERYRGRPMSNTEGMDNMRWSADLYAATAELYEYARDEELMKARAPYAALRNALRLSGIMNDDHPIFDHIRPRPSVTTAPPAVPTAK